MELASVAALADNRVIGRNGEVPWDFPEDKRQYRARVADAPVILGRRTFESMLDDLPGRVQIVLSRTARDSSIQSAEYVTSVQDAIDLAATHTVDTTYVIGGAAIYHLFQPHLDRMILTRVPGTYEGDAYYPEWEPANWTLVDETTYEGFTVQDWKRAQIKPDWRLRFTGQFCPFDFPF